MNTSAGRSTRKLVTSDAKRRHIFNAPVGSTRGAQCTDLAAADERVEHDSLTEIAFKREGERQERWNQMADATKAREQQSDKDANPPLTSHQVLIKAPRMSIFLQLSPIEPIASARTRALPY